MHCLVDDDPRQASCGVVDEEFLFPNALQNIGAKHAAKPDVAQNVCLTKTIIPVMINKKDVLKGDALIYLKRTAPSQDARQVKPISNRPLLVKMLSQEKTEES